MRGENMEKSKLFLLVSWCLVSAWGIVAVRGEIKTFRSPMITLGPGEVANDYFRMEMPSGHTGITSFYGEIVDEDGNSVPLSEVYLHHWIAMKVHTKKGTAGLEKRLGKDLGKDRFLVPNAGTCSNLPQFYGLGSETRHTDYMIPEPYAIEIGNPEEVPEGYEEQWILNVHSIDTRGAVNPMYCLECRCASYNVSVTEYGKKVPEEYIGGLQCCTDGAQCALKEDVHEIKRNLFFQYTVEYFPMAPTLKPVRVYILDVTDDRQSPAEETLCEIEYNVMPCDKSNDLVCQHEKHSLMWLLEKEEVDVIYVNGHVHASGVSLALLGEGGREICTSEAIYGTGNEAGNETGYVVGMTSCYPEIGTLKIKPGETLHLNSVYNSDEFHTGVMGLMYILVADPIPNKRGGLSLWMILGAVVIIAIAAVITWLSMARYLKMKRSNVGYESLVQA